MVARAHKATTMAGLWPLSFPQHLHIEPPADSARAWRLNSTTRRKPAKASNMLCCRRLARAYFQHSALQADFCCAWAQAWRVRAAEDAQDSAAPDGATGSDDQQFSP